LHELQIKDRADGCGVCMFVHGKGEVFLHFEINLIIGDTSGHDILTGHNQCYSKKVPIPFDHAQLDGTTLTIILLNVNSPILDKHTILFRDVWTKYFEDARL
jgi:hypothetical protein